MAAGKGRIYGYCRISTPKQNIQRQIDNIKTANPDAVIIEEAFTGTTTDRPKWQRLEKTLRAGDTVIFDEVSRMSRNAADGFALYEKLYREGVELVFLKEPHINTATYRETLEHGDAVKMTGTDIDIILEAVNRYLMALARRQIELAFQTAQAEVDFLHKRTSEGVRRAQAEGKQIGRAQGAQVETRKAKESKAQILKRSSTRY